MTPEEHDHYLIEHVIGSLKEKYGLKEPVTVLCILDETGMPMEIYNLPFKKTPGLLELFLNGFSLRYEDDKIDITIESIMTRTGEQYLTLKYVRFREGESVEEKETHHSADEDGLFNALWIAYRKAKLK